MYKLMLYFNAVILIFCGKTKKNYNGCVKEIKYGTIPSWPFQKRKLCIGHYTIHYTIGVFTNTKNAL